MTPYRPWLCLTGHRLEIEEVTEEGECVRCGSPVGVKTTPEEARHFAVQEAVDRTHKDRQVRVGDRWVSSVMRECVSCHMLFKTHYPQQKYHSEKCKEKHTEVRKERKRMGVFVCMFCGAVRESKDQRRKFCNRQCRLGFRGRKV